MDEIFVDIELIDEIVVDALQDDEVSVTIEDADEIEVEAFDYPPVVDQLNSRVAACEENSQNAIGLANAALETATESAVLAATANEAANSAGTLASQAAQAAQEAAGIAEGAAQSINTHATATTNPHPTNVTQEFADTQITPLAVEATYTPTVWGYIIGLFTTVPKSLKEHIVKVWLVMYDFSLRIGRLEIVQPVAENVTFTLALTHLYKGIRCNSATAMDCNIPLNNTVAFPIGSIITIQQIGNGVVTVKGVSGVTLNGDAKTSGQYKFIQLWKTDINVWNVIGGVA